VGSQVRETATESEEEEFKGEAETMLELDHENLVKLLGVSMQQTPWLCVIEYMQVRTCIYWLLCMHGIFARHWVAV